MNAVVRSFIGSTAVRVTVSWWRSSCRRLMRSLRGGTTTSTTSGRLSQEGVYSGGDPREKGAQEAITVEATLPEMRSDLASLVDLLDVRYWHRLLSVVSSTER